MSKDFVTVDYFSHHWDASDLGCASQELNRQIAQVRRKLITVDDDLETQHDSLRQWGLGSPKSASRALSSLNKDKHRLLSDEYRLSRLENISWRQFKASRPKAPKIDPIDINWQKNSDVIWLYGPLFRRDENDTEFEKRLGCVGTQQQKEKEPTDHSCSDTTPIVSKITNKPVKPALSKRNLSKEEYVEKMLGKNVLKKYKRRSFPVDQRGSFDLTTENNDNDNDSTSSRKKRTLRFKPDVLEFIYHADVPLQNNHSRRPSRGRSESASAAPRNNGSSSTSNGSKNISSAAQRAKALLLAARSSKSSPSPSTEKSASSSSSTTVSPSLKQAPIMPPSPPLSPSDEGYIKFHSNETHTSSTTITSSTDEDIKSTEQQGGWWAWPSFYYSSSLSDEKEEKQMSTSLPPQEQQQQDPILAGGVESIPSLCANLFSLSAEMLTLMGTVAVYKGVSYGLGCPASQQQQQESRSTTTITSVPIIANRANTYFK
ncbi:hypothetical protein BDA99DRAFT_532767 [Phascolomyces articulosus]|uniref:Uncharacterized protein n=1 Tax=Phascolomyces articulosus TaxID=60185 RepID=A0AAD5KNA1_9FUNG|nr:hypothetical protein BDA99DRAFT_532767 [Phascolomyces articulosus]